MKGIGKRILNALTGLGMQFNKVKLWGKSDTGNSLDAEAIPLTYSFRIRFNRSQIKTIQLETSKLPIPVVDERLSIALLAQKEDMTFLESEQLALMGSGYDSDDEAELAGRQFQNVLMVALARVRIGADFGYRAAKSIVTNQGLKWLEEKLGQKVLHDNHGLMVFSSNPKPRFASFNAKATIGVSPDAFLNAIEQTIAIQPQISDKELLAYTLFNASFFQPTADSRFLLLVMAVEALLEPANRSKVTQEHISSLIKQTKNSALILDERNSILGSLRWLYRESINQAGKRLSSERLGVRTYGNKIAADFFSYCYQLRSNLVHGNQPVPTFDEIANVVGQLEVFVSDLLTGPILGHTKQ